MSKEKINKKSILFVYTGFSTFVKNDLDILAEAHLVDKYHYAPVKGLIRNALVLSRQFFYLLIFGWKYDLFFCWFADFHSFLPALFARLTGKKTVVVIGGYDVCRIRDLNYGAFCNPFRGWFSACSMKLAGLILPVSGYVARKARIIAPRTRQEVIYNCVSLEGLARSKEAKSDMILTVGVINNERTFYLKGIDTFIETARLLPGFRFVIVGIDQAALVHKLGNLPNNLNLHEKVEPQELVNFYRRSKIYCQLSRSESFGVSLAEAMSFGNYPVVTWEGGMPEVIGPIGAVVERNPQKIVDVIKGRLLREGCPDENTIRMYVIRAFSLKKRKEALLRVIGQKD